MGKIRTKTTKRAARKVVENHFSRLGRDYYVNKRVILDVTLGTSKKLKNKIAGYATHIMKRLARGPVRGISLKMQEEEREKRLDFVPEVPWMDLKVSEGINIDAVTQRMLKRMETGVPRAVRVEDVRRPAAKGKRAAPPAKGRGAAAAPAGKRKN
jgi:small subunit ribosomal protein S17e